MTFSADEWEKFTEECLSARAYVRVARLGGAGDMGLDVICFTSAEGFVDSWDNYQCKHYDHALYPSDIWKEISKVVYYTFIGEYTIPRKYYFVAPKGIGTTGQRLLSDTSKLKAEAKTNWVQEITPNVSVPLTNELLAHFDEFDFSIFSSVSVAEMIAEHAGTAFHAVRFGGGLPPRPPSETPPIEPAVMESNYVLQLFRVYGQHLGVAVTSATDLSPIENGRFSGDFLRHRERFYHAESLRNFARDTVPEGTFENLQEEIHSGVIDVYEKDGYADGLERLRETMSQAANMSTPANALHSVVQVQDKQGICHQLANNNRLLWVREDVDG